MGIPSYFSHIIKNYSNIIRNLGYFVNDPTFRFQHLYMDCNSIVYDSVHALEKKIKEGGIKLDKDFESVVIDKVISNINDYVKTIRPTETLYISFDGVAPFAKMDQQRTRRYKSLFMSKISFTDEKSAYSHWNTSAITPGTEFMKKLSQKIEYAFQYKELEYNVKRIVVTCSNKPGEGEHKIYNDIRNNDFKEDSIAVYGLDSDLIMLSIFHLKYCNNIYVFREAPEFLKSSIPIDIRGKESEPHFLDIRHLASSILSEMNCAFSDEQRIYDYVFLCFFLGNDFLPHFPAMNIRTHGIQALLDIYRMSLGAHQDRHFIAKNNKIQWKNVGIFVNEIAKREHDFLMNEYFVRDKFDSRPSLSVTPKEKEEAFQNAPIRYRQEEKYICPSENKWEERYYKVLFSIKRSNETLKPICNNYLEGLEWVFKYYTSECPDWRWKYNYHYPPLFKDLHKYIPHFEMDFITTKNQSPFSQCAQLSYVLPRENLAFMPKKYHDFLIHHYSELYPEQCDFQWAFCRYFWESHPVLPDIPVELLEQWDIQFKLSGSESK